MGARGATAKPPPVFLLNVSGQRSQALAAAQLRSSRLPLSLSRGSPDPLILDCLCAAGLCSLGRARWLRGPLGAAPLPAQRPRGLHQCQTRATISRAGSCPSCPPERAGSSQLGPSSASLRICVFQRPAAWPVAVHLSGLCPPLGEAASLPDLAWAAPRWLMTGAACGAPACPQRLVLCFSHVGLGLSSGLLVGFTGDPDPPNSTEVERCGLTVFNLVGNRIFVPEFDLVCHMGWEQNTLSTSVISVGYCGARCSAVPSCAWVSLQ